MQALLPGSKSRFSNSRSNINLQLWTDPTVAKNYKDQQNGCEANSSLLWIMLRTHLPYSPHGTVITCSHLGSSLMPTRALWDDKHLDWNDLKESRFILFRIFEDSQENTGSRNLNSQNVFKILFYLYYLNYKGRETENSLISNLLLECLP